MARKILGIAGSLRKDSHNKAVLRTLAEDADIEVFDLASIPLYNGDLDDENLPRNVRQFKDAIAQSAGVLLVTPEYNYGVPGVLKNALDWASRPAYRGPLVGKPVGIITCSMSTTGGARAHSPLRTTLFGCLAEVVTGPEVAIASVHTKIENGVFTDPKGLEVCQRLVKALKAAAQL